MTTSVSASTISLPKVLTFSPKTTPPTKFTNTYIQLFTHNIKHLPFNSTPSPIHPISRRQSPILANPTLISISSTSSPDEFLDQVKNDDGLLVFKGAKPVKFALWVLFWASLSVALFAISGDAEAAVDSIRGSNFGFTVANRLRGLGWTDEAVVFALATLPIIELRGAIPVGYWMQLKPTILTLFAILGNMVPVPFIILYLKPFASFLAGKNKSASQLLDILFKRAKDKASPVEEFQWLGLMLFVAVPFPGTGAWTGAIIASVLDMPFWQGVTANLCGVMLAGLLVNLLVNLGIKYAILTGIVLFFISTFMWTILRNLRNSLNSSD